MKCFLGISLGNPYYSRNNIIKYIRWAEEKNYELAFLIGDGIHKYTYSVFKNVCIESALEVSLEMGRNMQKNIMRAINYCSKDLNIYRWVDIRTNSFYIELNKRVLYEYNNNIDFKKCIRYQVFENLKDKIYFYEHEKNIQITNQHYNTLDKYVIDEICGLITMSEFFKYYLEIYPGKDLTIISQIYTGKFKKVLGFLNFNLNRKFLSLRFDDR